MARRNNQTNSLIKWWVNGTDFVLLNGLLWAFSVWHPEMSAWTINRIEVFWVVYNLALALMLLRFSTNIHLRVVSGGEIMRRGFEMTVIMTVVAYLIMRVIEPMQPVGWVLITMGCFLYVLLMLKRFVERNFVKLFRMAGMNTRTVTFVGSDPELMLLYKKLVGNTTLGFKVRGYYANEDSGAVEKEKQDSGAVEKQIQIQKQKEKEEGLPFTVYGLQDSGAVQKQIQIQIQKQKQKEKETNTKTKTNTEARGEKEIPEIVKLGSLDDLIMEIDRGETPDLGEELYVCLPRRERDILWLLSEYCDMHMVRFYYVPPSVERLGLSLRREFIEEMEVYTTYEIPLENPVNKLKKRIFDIVLSILVLLVVVLIFPIVALVTLIQSPGPIFFRQVRTGVNGKEFMCYKFRSMHVNKDADRVQATEHDPRKFPFGNFMRKYNIDELPQFWNVLVGDMSVVGPRPHMLMHTEFYSHHIGKYMVRHFVKPGITGWAQVTGFRGETKELWQMKGRVKRDIWYIENWSIWLDVRIVWMTIKGFFVHDENAY